MLSDGSFLLRQSFSTCARDARCYLSVMSIGETSELKYKYSHEDYCMEYLATFVF